MLCAASASKCQACMKKHEHAIRHTHTHTRTHTRTTAACPSRLQMLSTRDARGFSPEAFGTKGQPQFVETQATKRLRPARISWRGRAVTRRISKATVSALFRVRESATIRSDSRLPEDDFSDGSGDEGLEIWKTRTMSVFCFLLLTPPSYPHSSCLSLFLPSSSSLVRVAALSIIIIITIIIIIIICAIGGTTFTQPSCRSCRRPFLVEIERACLWRTV